MKRILSAALVTLITAGGCASRNASNAHSGSAAADTHGHPGHIVIPADQSPFKPGPPSLPPGAQIATLEGDPTKPGFFTMRLKFPDGYRVPPHTHPGFERVTVIAGTLNLGNGATFDPAATRALPAGSYSSMQPNMQHFAWMKGETILQLTTMGPWQINYVNPADDPRKQAK